MDQRQMPGDFHHDGSDVSPQPPPEPTQELQAVDLGRKPPKRHPADTLTPGLANEDLWLLVRRFNKQIYHVKAAPNTTEEDLDLNRAEDEQFPPEKLRMTIERFYTSVVIGVMGFCRHVARLRSWREPRRTAVFCTVYFVAWWLDIILLVFSGLLIALILSPRLRPLLFPAMATVPAAAGAGDKDSVTGVPERYKGEAAEREAQNLVNSVATIAVQSASGKYGQAVPEDAEKVDEPESIEDVVDAAAAADAAEDKTQKPMKKKVARGTDQAMRAISNITDVYEKFGNVFSPTSPFLAIVPRLRLVGILVSIGLASVIVSSHLIIKAAAFAIGLGFFGGPIITHAVDYLNRKIPNWREHLDLQKTLLKGVPTNAQLTLTLLRIGEINSSPLPPPPSSEDVSSSLIGRKAQSLITLAENKLDAIPVASLDVTSDNPTPPSRPKRRWLLKVLKFVRRTIATAIKSHVAFDRAMRIANSAHTRNLIEMLQKKVWVAAPSGPLKFEAKFQRKRGTAVIDSSQEPPVLYFTTVQASAIDDLKLEHQKKSAVLFQIPVSEIHELKKTEGLGWKGKLIVELTAGSKEAADGLVISGGESEESYHLTGMRARNQLFNRLIAIDAQFWESR
ncbi:uncharacterized protein ACLA_063660 [Aspergillus clavatus NRRL 1]|uniref:Uncharacterized protein n=1 Tax=Aspergillus clavatus (strain ATCC 1007 / CBS 513.65 / DSM 816 / NCTC 3887 / NRRL 1 / QM 1276 / 107) TaxID=344612 RepID=A1CCZ0_ASPCL|nr:uncharacterized protein ACLA_063660 [Aspergillus clavatus NRRL 1]EAW12397.1 conserved hypothetical protein [Aspergillus clavatus NRRL 1]